jgi:O-antigen/teichoic acid export membrane protein
MADRLGRQSIAYGLASLVGPGTGLLLLPVYTRYLSASDFGFIALLEVVSLLLATVFSLGMTAMVPFYYVDEPDPGRRRRRLGSLLVGVTLLNVALTALVVSAGGAVLGVVMPSVPATPFLPILALTALLEPYWIVAGAILQIQERAGRYSALSVARVALSITLRIVAVVVLAGGVTGFLAANLATAAVTAAVVMPLLRREAALVLDVRELWRALAVGGPTVPNNLLSYGFRSLDRVIMERFVSHDQIGVYYLALRLADVLRLGADVLISAWRPVFFKEAGDARFVATVAPDVIRLVAIGFLGMFVVLSLFAREAVALLLAPAFAAAAPLVPVLLAAMAIKALTSFPHLVLWYRKRAAYMPVLTLVALGVSLGANLVLTPRLGTWGIATSLLLSWVVLFVLTLAVARRLYPLPYPWRPIGFAATVAVVAVAAGAPLDPGPATIALKLGLVLAWGGALVLTGCVTVSEIRAVAAPLRRRAGRPQAVAS